MNKQVLQIKLNGIIYTPSTIDKLFQVNEPKDSWKNAIFYFLLNWFDTSDTILSHTSGSTGRPKEIKLSKQTMINSARMTNEFFCLDNTKTALLCLPASYIAGKMMLVRAMIGRFNILTVEPKADPFARLNAAIDFAAITPYQLHHSIESLKHKHVKNCIVGGGAVSATLENQTQSLSTDFYETYGMTETASHIALRCFKGEKRSNYFTALSGILIQKDERDCLVIKVPHLLNNKIITNDLVELKDENSFRWLGRFDAVINSGGVKIHPEQVEKKLEAIITNNFFISSQPDELLGSKVILVMESSNCSVKETDNLIVLLHSVLTKYEVPKQIYCLPAFCYSDTGKLLRLETAKQLKFID